MDELDITIFNKGIISYLQVGINVDIMQKII